MSKRLQVSISNALNKALEEKAKVLHITPQDAARMAIVEWVARPIVPAQVRPIVVEMDSLREAS